MDLSRYIKPDLEYLREQLNLTEDEEQVFLMLSKKKSRIQISDRLKMSVRTVDNRIRSIKDKMGKMTF